MKPEAALRGAVRRSGYRRLSHGLYAPVRSDSYSFESRLADLAAFTLLLPPGGCFTHLTSAWLRGWWMPRLTEQVPIFVAAPGPERVRRPGLVASRLPESVAADEVQGLPVAAAEETLLRVARDLGMLDLVVMLDSARRLGQVDESVLGELLATRRAGVRALRHAYGWTDARSESPFETLLRLFHQFAGIEVEPQAILRDSQGRALARADLLVRGTRNVHEYDGEVHAARQQRVRDLRRDRLLAELGYVRRGFVSEDLLGSPLALLQELDRALGRRHRPERAEAWRRTIADSSYSREGRDRIQNRWLRTTVGGFWPQNA